MGYAGGIELERRGGRANQEHAGWEFNGCRVGEGEVQIGWMRLDGASRR